MSVEVKSLLDELDALQAELEMLPTGCLATHKRKNHEYYGIQKMINGKSSETYVALKEYPFKKCQNTIPVDSYKPIRVLAQNRKSNNHLFFFSVALINLLTCL